MTFANSTVVVTGASAGNGRATARAFAKRGARVALIARGEAGLKAAQEECLALGARQALAVPCDVADAEAVDAAAERIRDELGPVDVWVNNAMVSVFARTWDITAAEFRRVVEVNLLGTVYGTLAALRQMRPRNAGVIVQVGSTLAYRGIPLQAPYCSTKHGIQGFVDSLRPELLRDCPGVKVTMVQLPAINTPQFSWVRTRLPRHPQPVPPIFQPEVTAEAIVWASEHAPRELNVTGRTSLVRMLNAVAPGALEWYLARTNVDAQQTDEPIDPAHWRDNLDSPGDGDQDHGAHGIFDDKAHTFSPEAWARTHLPLVAGAGALLATAAAIAARTARK
jgi:NAD(P)-dependent dehydrogenase (short-subunit alcohol dehydrogenase family)